MEGLVVSGLTAMLGGLTAAPPRFVPDKSWLVAR
jgi:hypothetical protein